MHTLSSLLNTFSTITLAIDRNGSKYKRSNSSTDSTLGIDFVGLPKTYIDYFIKLHFFVPSFQNGWLTACWKSALEHAMNG